MKAVGYTLKGRFIPFLKELSICCSVDELNDIVDFLLEVQKHHAQYPNDLCHSHYRDFNPKWTEDSSDIIIMTRDDL